jgi:hypothetical protein
LDDLKRKLRIKEETLKEVNDFILREDNPLMSDLLKVVKKYGGVDEINRKAREARSLESLITRLREKNSPFVKDLEWLVEQRNNDAFISIPDYRRKILGDKADSMKFDESFAVTLEISACNFFPWLIEE